MALGHRLVDPRLAAERRLVDRLRRVGVAVVVLGAGADVRRKRFAVHPDLLVALAVPGGDGIEEREGVAHIDAAARELDEIPVAVGRGLQAGLVVPGRVEVHGAVIPRPRADGGAKGDLDRLLGEIGQRDPRVLLIRHRPAAHHRAVGEHRAIPALQRGSARRRCRRNRSPDTRRWFRRRSPSA